MASSIPPALGRKVLAASLFGGGISPLSDERSIFGARLHSSPSTASCEAPPAPPPRRMARRAPEGQIVLRKKMTSVGRFSLKSETKENPSIPAFFLALSGTKNADGDAPTFLRGSSSPRVFTVADFERAWLQRGMPARHPRFHSTVDEGQRYFEETHRVHPPSSSASREDDDEDSLQIKADLDRHATETVHFSAYREELRGRLERCLVSPLEVSDKLWEVAISSGPLGASGAISRAKCAAIRAAERNAAPAPRPPPSEGGGTLRRRTTKGGPWRDAVVEAERIPMESVLLFRSHHALADGASILAALSDLCDEAEDIRADIQVELNKWQRGGSAGPKTHALRRVLSRLARLLRLCLWCSVGTLGAVAHAGYLRITTRRHPFDAAREEAARRGATAGRSLSWCDAAALEDAKAIARIVGAARGLRVTVNDLFVSCATAAVARQLREHAAARTARGADERARAPRDINVVVPVHLRGGVVLPHESVGNHIGAFVARCPAQMEREDGGAARCPTERLCRVHRSLLYSKRSPAPFVSYHLARFCSNYLPDRWTKALFQSANANACLVVSNNRGYDKKMHINGMAVESAVGFLPLPPGIPVGVVVQSYAGTMSLTVVAERWAVPDADQFLGWVLDEYRGLSEAARKLEKEHTVAPSK